MVTRTRSKLVQVTIVVTRTRSEMQKSRSVPGRLPGLARPADISGCKLKKRTMWRVKILSKLDRPLSPPHPVAGSWSLALEPDPVLRVWSCPTGMIKVDTSDSGPPVQLDKMSSGLSFMTINLFSSMNPDLIANLANESEVEAWKKSLWSPKLVLKGVKTYHCFQHLLFIDIWHAISIIEWKYLKSLLNMIIRTLK